MNFGTHILRTIYYMPHTIYSPCTKHYFMFPHSNLLQYPLLYYVPYAIYHIRSTTCYMLFSVSLEEPRGREYRSRLLLPSKLRRDELRSAIWSCFPPATRSWPGNTPKPKELGFGLLRAYLLSKPKSPWGLLAVSDLLGIVSGLGPRLYPLCVSGLGF